MPAVPEAGGSLILPGALVIAAFSTLVGCVVWLTKQWVAAKNDQITDLRQRVNLLDSKVEKLTERLDGGVAAAVGELHDQMMARFQDVIDAVQVSHVAQAAQGGPAGHAGHTGYSSHTGHEGRSSGQNGARQ